MDHPRIEEEQIIDRYLVGRLSPEDEALFEEHLFACEACLEKVELGEELRRGLQEVAAEDGARVVSVGLLAWLAQRPAQLAGLVGAGLLLVLLSSVLLLQRGELERLRSSQTTVGFSEPLGDLQVISLGVVRDTGTEVEIRPDPSKAVLLSLELQEVGAESYRVTLRDASGEELWRGEDLEPNLYDTLLVALPASFLEPGSYGLIVEGQAVTSTAVELNFQVPFVE